MSKRKLLETGYELPKERRLWPIHRRDYFVGQQRSIRKSILDAIERKKKL
jgi:hypothetical protein